MCPVPIPLTADLASLGDLTWSFLQQLPPESLEDVAMTAQAMLQAMAQLKMRVEQLEAKSRDDDH